MFTVSTSIKDNSIIGSLEVDSYFFEPSKYEYAFYLYNNEKKVAVKWYTKDMSVIFDLEDKVGLLYIKVFIRDLEHINIRNFDSEKIVLSA